MLSSTKVRFRPKAANRINLETVGDLRRGAGLQIQMPIAVLSIIGHHPPIGGENRWRENL